RHLRRRREEELGLHRPRHRPAHGRLHLPVGVPRQDLRAELLDARRGLLAQRRLAHRRIPRRFDRGRQPVLGAWEFFLSINPLTDVLFMLGLLGVGVAFMLGIGTRLAAVSAAAMYTLMYLAAFPIASNPLYDTHLLMAVAVIAMAGLAAGDHVGLGKQWHRLVRGNRFLL